MNDIYRRHWLAVGERFIGLEVTTAILDEISVRAERAISIVQEKLPEDFPVQVADAIFAGIKSNLARLAL